MVGDLTSKKKEDIRRELEIQLELGGEGLATEDKYLLEINLDDSDTSSGEDQVYWRVAFRTAWKAWELRREQVNNNATESSN